MTHRLRPLLWISALLSLVILSLGLPTAASAGDRTITRNLTFTTVVTSVGTDLNELPGDIVYGWNHLQGPTRWGTRKASLDFLGSVDYIDGSGPFGGFVTITHANGMQLALNVDGQASSPPVPGTTDTTFSGQVTVIGGSGRFAGATGYGTMTGFRTAALGGAVNLTFSVTVTRPA